MALRWPMERPTWWGTGDSCQKQSDWAILKVNLPALCKSSDDWNPCQYLKYNYIRDLESQLREFSTVQSLKPCLTLCYPMDCSTPGFLVHYQFAEFTQTHVHWVGDAIQPSHPLSSPSPPAFKLSQHQGLCKWVSSSHQVANLLEFQLQHQS